MAVTIPDLTEDPTYYDVVLNMYDTKGEPKQVRMLLDGALTTAELQAGLRAYEALTNAAFRSVIVLKRYEATGARSTPVAALEQLVAVFAALTFTRENPVNTDKVIVKGIGIPAYIDAIMGTDDLPVSDNANLNTLTAFLEDALVIEGSDGTFYAGEFIYQRGESGFGTALTKTDKK